MLPESVAEQYIADVESGEAKRVASAMENLLGFDPQNNPNLLAGVERGEWLRNAAADFQSYIYKHWLSPEDAAKQVVRRWDNTAETEKHKTAPDLLHILSTPEGREKLARVLKEYPTHLVEALVEALKTPGKAYSGEADPSSEGGMERAVALATVIGPRFNKLPLTGRTGGIRADAAPPSTDRQPEPLATTLKGDELGNVKNIKELRDNAYRYYENRFVKSRLIVKNEQLGDIMFYSPGLKKTTRVGEDLLRAIPAVPEMLKKGRCSRQSRMHWLGPI
jgi:hypothetical protein